MLAYEQKNLQVTQDRSRSFKILNYTDEYGV